MVVHTTVTPTFLEEIKRRCKSNFLLEYVPNGIKVRTSTIDDKNCITNFLNSQTLEHYTFDADSRSTIKYVIRGLPATTESTELISALASKEVTPITTRQLSKTTYNPETSSRETTKLPIWVVVLKKSQDEISKLKSIVGLLNFRVRIEDYRGRSDVQQCYRCQKFGHKANQCSMKPRCAKCANSHNTRDCPQPQPQIENPKCANCGGNHQANSQECPDLQKFKRSIESRSRTAPSVPKSTEFPPLPHRMGPPPTPSSTSLPAFDAESFTGLSEILSFFTSGSFKRYLIKFKEILRNFSRQPDLLSKCMTLCNGAMELFSLSEQHE